MDPQHCLYVHTAGGGKGYTLYVHTAGGGKDKPCTCMVRGSPIHIGLDCIKTPELSKSCSGTFNNYLTAALFYDIKKIFLGHLCIRAGTVVVLNLAPPVISY